MIFSKITLVGKAELKNKVTNEMLSKVVDTNDDWIVSRTGIKTRYISTGETTSDIATSACNEILSQGVDPLSIDCIILATITSDFNMPSTACIVQDNIGATNAFAFDINAACTGFVYALSVADGFIKSGKVKKALVIGAEVLSKIVDFEDRSTCVLFGDGAAAVLLESSDTPGIIDFELKSDGSKKNALVAGETKPKSYFSTPDDLHEQKYIAMDGREIFNFVVKKVPQNILSVMNKNKLTSSDINYVIPHQANARLIDTLSKSVGIDISKFYMNIDRYGNTSSASVPIALYDIIKESKLNRDDLILLTAFGGGLTFGTMLIKY